MSVLFILIKFNLRNGVQKKNMKAECGVFLLKKKEWKRKGKKKKKESTQTQTQEGGTMLQRRCVRPSGAPGSFSLYTLEGK